MRRRKKRKERNKRRDGKPDKMRKHERLGPSMREDWKKNGIGPRRELTQMVRSPSPRLLFLQMPAWLQR